MWIFDHLPIYFIKKYSFENLKNHFLYRELFESFDDNQDGIINFDEFKKFIQETGRDLDDKTLSEIFVKADSDHSGGIDFEEFQIAMKEYEGDTLSMLSEIGIESAFKDFDRDGNGEICSEELSLAMAKLGIDIEEEEIELLLESADTNKNGSICMNEFRNMVKGGINIIKKKPKAKGITADIITENRRLRRQSVEIKTKDELLTKSLTQLVQSAVRIAAGRLLAEMKNCDEKRVLKSQVLDEIAYDATNEAVDQLLKAKYYDIDDL